MSIFLYIGYFMFPFWAGWLLADGLRVRRVPGSLERYRYATIEHALRYPAMIMLTMMNADSIVNANILGVVIFTLCQCLWWRDVKRIRRSDDDDWFKGAGKRIKKWAASSITFGNTAPSPA